MTCPEIGNYGVSRRRRRVARRRRSPASSSATSRRWRATGAPSGTLRDYLVANRHRRHLRHRHARADAAAAVGRRDARRHRDRRRSSIRRRSSSAPRSIPHDGRLRSGARRDLASTRSTGREEDPGEFGVAPERLPTRRLQIAAYDFGMKWNILRRLSAHGCDVRVYPATTPASRAARDEARRRLPQQRPRRSGAADLRDRERAGARRRRTCRCSASASATRFSASRWAARTFKLKFGHRGANHPVKKLATGKVEITSQNHGFAVDPASLPADVEVTHLNLYDGTVEGLRHTDAAGVLRAVPSRGVARPARRRLPVRRFPGS